MVLACCCWGINNFLTDHKTMQNRENLAEFKIYVLSSTSCTNRPPEIQHTNDQPDINTTPNPSLLCKRCQSRRAWGPGDQPRPPRCGQAEGQRVLNDVVGPCCGAHMTFSYSGGFRSHQLPCLFTTKTHLLTIHAKLLFLRIPNRFR